MIAKVEPLTQARALRGPFDYRVPDRMEAGVGSVLVVPFGRRRVLGVVVDTAERSEVPAEKLVEPIEALEGGVPPELVRLGLWTAEEYVSTPARGLSLVLPPGTGTGARQRTRARRALRASLTAAGRDALDGGERLGAKQREALERLAGGPLPAALIGHATVRRLEARGLVTIEEARVERRPEINAVGARGDVTQLTAAQAAAVERIDAAFDQPGASLLLHGVTGSGKTEVYLRAAARALERGRSVIVLVPEIGLTPQTAARFERRFGELVAIMHSKLSAGERFDEWARLRSGEARICVGPRSAVFAPLSDVGLIVIDEEHDPSYKQEGDPRYDARRVAERRAEQAGAVLLAGSATPRPESFERLERIRLPERVDGQRPAARRGRGHGRRDRAAASADARRARGRAARRGEGDRPAQPARLVELPLVPGVRPGVEVPAVRRLARAPPGRRQRHLPPLRPPRARAGLVSRLRLDVGRTPWARDRAARARARGDR